MIEKMWPMNLMQRLCPAILAVTAMTIWPALAQTTFQPIDTQYIAALGDPQATSGNDAASWGLWATDPGPRSIAITDYADLVANAYLAPAGWTLDPKAWWLEEHGRIMETPSFPLPAGRYVVTGGRALTSVLTIQPPDETGKQAWSLADGARIYDVTHFGCRAALYSEKAGTSCRPDNAPLSVFPMSRDRTMPAVDGCSKRDYQVLIVVGMMVDG